MKKDVFCAAVAVLCCAALAAGTPPLVRLPHRGKGLEGRFHPTYASAHAPETSRAKDVPPFLRGSVMYQLFTRMFTPEGTFTAARAKLKDLKADGVDIVYLTPHQLADDDPDPRFWSGRQKACKLNNPKNPYRQKDFFAVDPEYGTKEDIFDHPTHPYTKGLFQSLPDMEHESERLHPIPGLPPDPTHLPKGCPFHPRCPQAGKECHEVPPYTEITPGHFCRCRKEGAK